MERLIPEKESLICLFVVQQKREDDSLLNKSSSLADFLPLLFD